MRKILYLHQYFKIPEDGGAIRSYYISKGMIAHGFEVEMITSHNKKKYEFKNIEGIHVHYLPVKYSNNYLFSKRYIAFIKFVFAAIKISRKLQRPDVCYATSTPLTVGLIALWLKWRRKISYIFEVRDLWPEAPIQLGIIKSNIIKRIALRLEKMIYKNADRIIALSPGIKTGIKQNVNHSNISMIPNMADIDFFNRESSYFYEKESFVIGYFGAFGIVNQIEYIIDAAEECQRAMLPVTFKLVGEGGRKNAIEELSLAKNLCNIEFLPHQNREETCDVIGEVDACFISFLNIPILETNSPNKFFDGLAAGKLCIVNTNGWLRELVEENECGFYTDPETSSTFPNLIRRFINDRKLLKTYQDNALKLGKSRFSKDQLVKKVCELIEH